MIINPAKITVFQTIQLYFSCNFCILCDVKPNETIKAFITAFTKD